MGDGAARHHCRHEQVREDERALPEVAPLRLGEQERAVPRGAHGEGQPGHGEEPQRELTEEEKAEQLRRYLEKLNPEDFGKFQL